jgi:4-amino-4-deoxy-L-arabinose transferase-like glycosyltransferase
MAAVQNPLPEDALRADPNVRNGAADACADSPGPASAHPRRWSSERFSLVALLAGSALLFTAGLGAVDLWAPDEPRYGAIAEELRSGRHGPAGTILLHHNGVPYTQKPPLYFWLAAAFGWPFGRVDEGAARLPSALAGITSVGVTYAIARLWRWPVPMACLAAGLLATSFRFAFTARRAQLDVLLCACELTAVALFLLLDRCRGGVERARLHPLLLGALHAALGAAALVKGPVGWLPLPVFAAYLALDGRLGAFRALVPAWSWIFSLLPLALWITGASALAPAGFAAEAVGTNVFARFFAGSSHARPLYYYAYQLPVDFLPWSLLWPFAIPAFCRFAWPSREARLLAAWILVPLAFFTLSAGKRGLYLLPIFPALALATMLALFARFGGLVDPSTPSSPANAATEVRPRRFALTIATVAGLELACALFLLPRFDAEKSPRPIAAAIARHRAVTSISGSAAAPVGLYGLRPLEAALVYYGAGPIRSLANEDETRAFLSAGGRTVLLRALDFEQLRARFGLTYLEGFRSGRRALVLAQVAAPLPKGDGSP